MGRIREEVMRQADEMLEAVRREVRAAAADRDWRVAAIEKKGRNQKKNVYFSCSLKSIC